VPHAYTADIFTNQIVKSEKGLWKLNDFNRCTFLYWNTTSDNETCPYVYTDYNAGLFRSPEEYAYTLQSEKIDVFALGNILYVLLTDNEPFDDMREEHNSTMIKEFVQNGLKPHLERDLYVSDDPSVKAIIEAMEMCHELDWRKRTRAIQVRDYLEKQLSIIISHIDDNKNISYGSAGNGKPRVQHDKNKEEGTLLNS
jgi:Protein kinase domain.